MNTFEDHENILESRSNSVSHIEQNGRDKRKLPDDLFLVSVPLDDSRTDHTAASRLHLQFGSLAATKRNNGKHPIEVCKTSKLSIPKRWIKIPEPHNTYPGINVRFINSWFNPVFVSFICLAVGITLFSQFLQSSTNSVAEISSKYEIQDVRVIFLALREHTVRSVNSTIWNLERTANFSLNAIVQASQSSKLNFTSQEKLPLGMKKKTVFDPNFLQSEKKRKISTNDSFCIPSELAQLNMSEAFLEARKQLQFVNNLAVPITNGSSELNDTAVKSVNFQVHRTAKIWIVTFVICGLISLICAGTLESWNWKRQKNVTYAKEIYDLHEIGFKLNHGLLAGASHLLSCKVNEWRGRDPSALFRARLEWCFNFCFSEFMLKILCLSMILAILSVACSSTLDQDFSLLKHSAASLDLINSAPFKQFRDHVNDSCYSLLANLLGNLGAIFEQCASALSSQGGLKFESLQPFNSVAFEQLSLPNPSFFTAQTPNYEASPHFDLFFYNWSFLQRVTRTLWIVSVVLLSCWIACGITVCGYAMRRLSIREGILYNTKVQHNTST